MSNNQPSTPKKKKRKKATPEQKRQARRRFRFREIKNYAINIFKPLPKKQIRVLLFAQGRSGSTLLENLICSTGYFKQRGELLGPFHQTKFHQGEALFPVHYMNGLAKQSSDENFIFHLKISHLTDERKKPVDSVKVLKRFQKYGWKIVFLTRRNRVKHALSNLVRNARGAAHKFEGEEEEKHRLLVDCDNFVERVSKKIYADALEREAVENVEHIDLVYEDDLEQADAHQRSVDTVIEFLGLEKRKAETLHRKVNQQSMEELIINYNEFRECVASNEWEHFLD
ncbi:MAG: hypothetical protein AAF889_13625 [Cyanobacteria bacterium P01_D01_bin.73]